MKYKISEIKNHLPAHLEKFSFINDFNADVLLESEDG